MKVKRMIPLLMAVCMLLALFAGCGGGGATTAADGSTSGDTNAATTQSPTTSTSNNPPASSIVDKTIRVGMDQEPESLDAATSGLDLTRWCTDPIFGRLVYLNDNASEIVPAIAESWTYETDTRIKFKLRSDVTFHNGRALVAKDIVFSLEYQTVEANAGVQYGSFAPYIESIEAPDDYTVILNLNSPYAAILSVITKIPVLCEEEMAKNASAPVSCGPFKFVSWDKNQTLKLEAFESYYEEGVPQYRYLTFNFYAGTAATLTAFMAGDVDLINWMSNIDIPTVEGLGNSYVAGAPSSLFYFQGKMTIEPFNKPGVMKALSLAVDREQMLELVLDGIGEVVSIPMTHSSPYYPDDVDYKKDIAQAKQLLSEAGYPDGFTCKLLAPLTAAEGVMAEVLQAQLAEIGVTVELEVLEVPAFLDKWAKGDFDLAICGHAIQLDPTTNLERWVSTDSRNYGKYENDEFAALVKEAAVTVDDARRKEMYYDIYHMFVDDAAIVYCFADARYTAVRNNIENVIKRYAYNDYTRLIIN